LKRVVFCLAILLAHATAWAQLTTGTINGVVKDSSGAVVPGVTVVVTNVDTGASRSVISDSQGRYQAPSLAIGNYSVKAELQGFQTTTRSGIELTVGRTAVVDLELKVGDMTEAVEVRGEAALLETTTATVSNLVDARRVVELPLINRDLTQLTFLQPGVLKMPTPGGGNSGSFSGMGDKLTVAGARGNQNIFMLDGVSNSDLSGNPQGATGGFAGAETIQEFQIITNNYSAEYRSQAGAIISAVTKSGSNRFRGSAFEFYRNDGLDAPNFFDKKFGVEKPAFDRNQFGGSFGGPILRNRTFFFSSYEGLRHDQGSTSTINVPTMAARQGILPTGPPVVVNPIMLPYLNLYPVPGQGNTVVEDLGNGTLQLAGETRETIDGDLFTTKIDHRFGDGRAGTMSTTYNFDDSARNNFGLLRSDALLNKKHALAVKHNSVWSSTTLLDTSFNFSDTQPEGDVPLMAPDDPSLVFTPGKARIGEIIVPNVDTLGTSRDRDAYFQRSYSLAQNLTFSKGRHSLRVGYEGSRYRYIQDTCSNGCFGSYTFRSLALFLQAVPRRLDARLPDAVSVKTLDQTMIGTYVQDNFRVTPTLTLNLGLRYEYSSVPKERTGATSHITDLTLETPLAQLNEPGDLYKNPMTKAFSPRVGFAWAPGAGKSSLRGGFGVYYEHPGFYHIRTALQEQLPFNQLGRIDDTDANRLGRPLVFPNAYSTQLDMLRGRASMRGFQYDLDTSYGYRWSLTGQRQFWDTWVATLGYTGSSFMNLWWQGLPNVHEWEGYPAQPAGPKFFPAGAPLINPELADARVQYSNADATYHGASLSVQKRFSAGFHFQAAYTYSKTIDDGSGVTSSGDRFPQGQRSMYAWDLHKRRGLSAYDIRNNFTANFTYALPFGETLSGFTGALARGWQVNGVLTLMDGSPLTVNDDSQEQADRIGSNEGLTVDLIPGGNANPVLGGSDRYYDVSQFEPSKIGYFGTLGRNTVIGPGLATFDASVFKTFALGQGREIVFRLEMFNLFNRVNLGTPDMDAFIDGELNPTAGQITSTRTPGRQTQLGVRFTF
jgi:outer membrane receptor protein involved in Fe transport